MCDATDIQCTSMCAIQIRGSLSGAIRVRLSVENKYDNTRPLVPTYCQPKTVIILKQYQVLPF